MRDNSDLRWGRGCATTAICDGGADARLNPMRVEGGEGGRVESGEGGRRVLGGGWIGRGFRVEGGEEGEVEMRVEGKGWRGWEEGVRMCGGEGVKVCREGRRG